MKTNRVAITGMGVISPLGRHLDEVWNNLVAGSSGITTVEGFDLSGQCVQIGGEVKNFVLDDNLMKLKDQSRYDRFIHFSLHATRDALSQAGITIGENYAPERVGSIIGVGMGGLPYVEKSYERFLEKGQRGVSPFFVPAIIPNMTTGLMSLAFGFKGPHFSVSSACASAGHALSLAYNEIFWGKQDIMISGGSESVLSNLPYGGFTNMKALSRGPGNPSEVCRPFDKDRSGLVMAEGAGILILENYEMALSRKAMIFAELVGHGASGDAHHITAPHPKGEGAISCMKLALTHAQISPEQVDYINAHGTSTLVGDACEILAIKEVFRDHAKHIKVSSTKSMTGHLLGAAGGIESIACVQALHTGILPPTINLDNLDSSCEGVDHVAKTSQKAPIQYALNNSFGFGGTNSSVLFKKV